MSQPNWKRPLALAVLLVVLGLGAFWLEYKHKPASEQKEEQARKVFALKDKAIDSIRMIEGSRNFAFRCTDPEGKLCKPGDNAQWELTQPLKVSGDDSNVNSLVSSLNNVTASDTIDLGTETEQKRAQLLKEYGLAPEMRQSPGARRIEVSLKDGTHQVAYLGESHPVGDSMFVAVGKGPENPPQVDETKVYLVPSYIKGNFERDLTYWRNKKLVQLATHQVRAFTVSGRHGKIRGERKDGQWILASGKNSDIPGDIESVDSLIAGATYLTARGFVAENKSSPKAKAELAKFRAFLTFAIEPEVKGEEKSDPVVLTLYESKAPMIDESEPEEGHSHDDGHGHAGHHHGDAPKPKKHLIYATVSNLDPVYSMDPGTRNRLDKSLQELRLTKLITSIDRFNTKKLEFSGAQLGDKTLTLANQDGKWAAEGTTTPVDSERVQALLDQLSGNRILEFIPEAKAPTGQDSGLRFTLFDEKNEPKRRIVFWQNAQKLYAKDLMTSRSEIFRVDPSLKDALPWSTAALEPGKEPAPKASTGDDHGHGHGDDHDHDHGGNHP